MDEKEIDRRDLIRSSEKLAEEMAQLHIISIKNGISSEEILDTFARIYLNHLLRNIDDEAKNCLFQKLDTNSKIYNSNTLLSLVMSWGIQISRCFLKAVAIVMVKHNRT